MTLNCGPPVAACVERRAACGASYNACASGATPCKFETRQPARPAGKRGRTVNFNGELAARPIRALFDNEQFPRRDFHKTREETRHQRLNIGDVITPHAQEHESDLVS